MINLAFHLRGGILILILFAFMFFSHSAFARVTPEDIINARQEAYDKKIVNYSFLNQQKLKTLGQKIAQINKKRSDELDKIMVTQAEILNEYERRSGGENKAGIEKVRYWVTFAHEAVAYQAAKIYIFDLSTEKAIRNDVLATINLFQSELNSTRSKVIYSQKVLKETVK